MFSHPLPWGAADHAPVTCRFRVLVAALIGVAGLLLTVGQSQSYAADFNTVPGTCSVTNLLASADPSAVRRVGRVPGRWPLLLDASGRATVNVDQAACTMTISGVSQKVTYSALTAMLDSKRLPEPERSRDTSDAMGLPANFYLLAWASDNRAFVNFLRTQTGLGTFVQYVPRLSYRFSAGVTHQLQFTQPAPARSPYAAVATLTESGFPVYPLTADMWRQTPLGSTMIETSHVDPSRMGIFTHWKVTTAPSTPLGRMIGGGGVQERTCTPALLVSPFVAFTQGIATLGCLSNESFVTANWRTYPPPVPDCRQYAPTGVNVPVCERQVAEARAATGRYLNVQNALRDGYVPISTCEQTSAGAMGIHFARLDRMITPSLNPAAPAMLLYLPAATGLRLIGAEYEASATVNGLPYYGLTAPAAAAVSPPPTMFGGKRFDGPMQGHSPAQPWHYDLHVWLWVTNPTGIFAQYNPAIHC